MQNIPTIHLGLGIDFNVINNYTQSVNTSYKFRIIAFSQAQWILKFEFYVLRNIIGYPVSHSNRDGVFSLGCF